MEKFISFFRGKKTYICGFAIIIVAGLQQLDVIQPEIAQTFIELLGGAGLVSLRLGMKK